MIDRASIFRTTWHRLATRHPRIRVSVPYATRGDTSTINDKVVTRAARLKEQIVEAIPKAVRR